TPVTCFLECGARLELEALLAIPFTGVQWNGVAELERSDRRAPRDTDSGRVTERLELRLLAVRVNLPGIEKHAAANALLALQYRIERLEIADDLAPTAERVAELVLRTERCRVVTAHRVRPSGEKRLEERQRLARQAVAVAEIGARHQHEVAVHRPVNRVNVLQLVIGEIAERQAAFEQHALQPAFRRIEDVVTRVTGPPGRHDVRVRCDAELVDEILVDRRTVVEQ